MALSVLDNERSDDARRARAFDILRRNLGRLGGEIDRTLVAARARARVEPSLDVLGVAEVLDQIVSDVESDAAVRRITVVRELDGTPAVVADRRLVESALSNLISNAIKFSRTDGRVAVRARRSGGHVLVEVEDECGGLTQSTLEKLFDRFVQLGQDRSGFGLGLAIAKAAVESHPGGGIRVLNLEGKGCVFVLELPAASMR